MMSLALCVGVAFLLVAGSAFAGTTALAVGSTVNNVALQVGKAAVVYTIPAVGTFSNAYTRTMGVAREAVSGNFFLEVTLLNGFTFNAGRLPIAGDVTLTTAGGGAIGAVTVFSGGTAGLNFVRFLVPVTTSFVTAPVFTVSTAAWTVNDVAGFLSGTSTVTSQIDIRTFDANTGDPFDSTGTNAASFMTAVNAMGASIFATTTAIIDTAIPSGRKNFVPTAPDTLTQDNGASIKIMVGDQTGTNPVHRANGTDYTVAAGDVINITVTGNLSGVQYLFYNYTTGTGAAPEVRKAIAPADITNGFATIAVPSTNALITALANGNVTVPLTIQVDNATQLTKRAFTVAVESTCAFNAANNRTGSNGLVAAGTALSTWDINGTVLMFNWTSANTAVYKSRMYIFNETSVPGAIVLVKLFQLPISSNPTAGLPIGNQVQLSKTLGAFSGMAIRLEDVIAAPGFGGTAGDLAGPDGSYNVAVEITIYTGVPAGSVTLGPVTGYGQTLNAVGAPSQLFGTVPLSRIQ